MHFGKMPPPRSPFAGGVSLSCSLFMHISGFSNFPASLSCPSSASDTQAANQSSAGVVGHAGVPLWRWEGLNKSPNHRLGDPACFHWDMKVADLAWCVVQWVRLLALCSEGCWFTSPIQGFDFFCNWASQRGLWPPAVPGTVWSCYQLYALWM